jgi:hypothetical protein
VPERRGDLIAATIPGAVQSRARGMRVSRATRSRRARLDRRRRDRLMPPDRVPGATLPEI